MLLKKSAHDTDSIASIQNDEYDEIEVMFSLIEYIVKTDLKGTDLLSSVTSKRLVAEVSKDNIIVDVSFSNETMPNNSYDISFVYIE